jgi:hypothetical protein
MYSAATAAPFARRSDRRVLVSFQSVHELRETRVGDALARFSSDRAEKPSVVTARRP